jgi:hypothetical protein
MASIFARITIPGSCFVTRGSTRRARPCRTGRERGGAQLRGCTGRDADDHERAPMLSGWQMIVTSAALELMVVIDAVRSCRGRPEEMPQFFVPWPRLMLWSGTQALAWAMYQVGAARVL